MDSIYEICKNHTHLTEEEIGSIKVMSTVLQSLANLEDADVFIDCPIDDGDSIVVAEAKPVGVPSSYKNSVVGMIAKKENEPAVARTVRLGVSTKHMKALTQENMYVIQSVEPIMNNQKLIGTLIRERRMEEQDNVQDRFHLLDQSYDTIADLLIHMGKEHTWLTEGIEEALLMINIDGIVTFRNSNAKKLYKELGYVEDVLGQNYVNIGFVNDFCNSEGTGKGMEINVGNHTLRINRIFLGINDVEFAVIIKDITSDREKEKELILKSVVIKEMHHRIKNNLQTIASLLRLQIRRTESEEAKTILIETLNRILSIAVTHQLLSQRGIDYVFIGKVISDIKNNITKYYHNAQPQIEIVLRGDDFEIESDTATTVALVINELLQNSLKYAFAENRQGLIIISVKKGSLYSSVTVTDNGCGFNEEQFRKEGLGLKIVQSLVEGKLRGNLKIESSAEGTEVHFDFVNQTTIIADAVKQR